uniref:Uncharacterized protein n=1 Tax=Micrurus lemniscatus lemniscatus TaxID=129467 RepID=A0A2D4HT38_MICLE
MWLGQGWLHKAADEMTTEGGPDSKAPLPGHRGSNLMNVACQGCQGEKGKGSRKNVRKALQELTRIWCLVLKQGVKFQFPTSSASRCPGAEGRQAGENALSA